MYMVFWKVWMHEWHMGQQIINRVIYITNDCEISWVIRLDGTGWPSAGTGIYIRLGPLINHKNSFLPLKEKITIAWQFKVPIYPDGGLALTSLHSEVMVSLEENWIKPNTKTRTNKKSKQRVASRFPVVQSWLGLEWGTRSLDNESLITGGQGTGTMRQLVQSRAKYSNGWDHSSCLAKPCPLGETLAPSSRAPPEHRLLGELVTGRRRCSVLEATNSTSFIFFIMFAFVQPD